MGIAINFDTLKISKELEKVGFSPHKPKTITKHDIAKLEHSLELLKYMVGVNIAILIALAMKFIFN